jgi:DNA (cytosine-5)-methyltransferase 1
MSMGSAEPDARLRGTSAVAQSAINSKRQLCIAASKNWTRMDKKLGKAKKKYKVAEFFSGCGGFSRGFTRTGRFDAVLGNDIKPEALKTFEFNHRHDDVAPVTVREDIRTVHLSAIDRMLQSKGVKPGELDCLIGGPPCQGFSQMRRTEERENGKIVKFGGYSKLAHDPRNDLVLRYLEIAERLRPKFILIENVPQMLAHGHEGRLGRLADVVVQMLEKDLGYSVDVRVLKAADYGVPQLRERAIFIASAIGTASFPVATHADPRKVTSGKTGLLPWVTVREALEGLPEPSVTHDALGGADISHYWPTKSDYAESMRSVRAFPHNHITREYNDSVMNIIKEMRPGKTWDAESERMRKKYERLIAKTAKEGGITERTAKSRLEKRSLINPVFYKDYYWSAYTRLDWDAPALTITANANFLGSGRFTHPEAMRGITMREAARLQSFDDDFSFITSEKDESETTRIGVGMDMIGEAVPPAMAGAIARHLAHQLDSM